MPRPVRAAVFVVVAAVLFAGSYLAVQNLIG
jgi:hypothetical protein